MIARNMQGMFTDLHIYSSYTDDVALLSWTTSCSKEYGDIINWQKDKINIEEFEDEPDTSFIAINKKDICPENANPTPREEAEEMIGANRIKRYKRSQISGFFVHSVHVLFYDFEQKSNMDCVDRCQWGIIQLSRKPGSCRVSSLVHNTFNLHSKFLFGGRRWIRLFGILC